jgi:predicted metal-binding membrane protein
MADLGLAPSSAHAAASLWLRRGLPLLLPLALTAAGWLAIALMLRDEGPSLASLFEDERLRAIFASLCRSATGSEPWWTLLTDKLAMWGAMTLGMMLPCAVPAWRMLLRGNHWIGGYGFLLGHSAAWGGFALIAAAIDTALQLTPDARLVLAPAALIVTGLHQLGPIKAAAVDAVRTSHDCAVHPAGPTSGLLYGWNCLRSDAVPMGLMLVFGSMNLMAMFALTALMLLEKARHGRLLTQASGFVLFALGATLSTIGAPA